LKILKYILGFLISIALVVLGIVISNYLDNGFWVSLFTIAVPVIGWYLFKNKQKQIGVGMLICSIPIGLLAILFILLSGLH
jgi:hypothetical protein